MTYIIDQHVHSSYSHDSTTDMSEHERRAREIGVKEITYTEHFDDYTGVSNPKELLNVDEYFRDYQAMGHQIKTRVGLEVGLRPDSVDLIHKVVNSHKFDLIIGSSHIVDNRDMGYDEEFFKEGSHKAVEKYLTDVFANCINYTDEFDVYGHIDYIRRYVNQFLGEKMDRIIYDDYRNTLNEILLRLISKGKGLEINTSGYRNGFSSPYPDVELLKEFKKKKGEFITIGSDAHKPEDLAYGFKDALDVAEAAGFTHITVFENREPIKKRIRDLR